MKEVCPRCRRSKYAKGSGSLTDWITCCRCDLKGADLDQGNKIHFCNTCGKRIREGRSGSLTQFIFRFDLCACDKPDWIPAPLPPVEELAESPPPDEVALDFNPNLFPIERYKPLSVLSEGITDGVYVCRDVILNKLVAVKIIHSAPAEKLIAFQNEAKRLSKLDASESDRILDFGATNAGAYQVLELRREDMLQPAGGETGVSPEDINDKDGGGKDRDGGKHTAEYSNALASRLSVIEPSAIQSISKSQRSNARTIIFGVVALAILAASSAYFIGRMDTAQKPVGTRTSRLLVPISHPEEKSSYHFKRVGHTFWLAGDRITRNAFKEIAADPSTDKQFTILFANDPKEIDWNGLTELNSRILDTLIAEHAPFGDEECKLVSTLPHIRRINLAGTKVTDRGIDILCDSKTLDTFVLSGAGTTSACLKSFLKKPKLESLECDGMPGFKLADLQLLCQFKRLRHLSVNYIRFGDNGLKIIALMPALRELEVGGCDLTDKGIKFLAGTKIRSLVLSHNAGITDRSVPYFEKMHDLVYLHFDSGGITAEAERRLKQSCPKLAVMREGGFGARVKGGDSADEAIDGFELLAPSVDADLK